MARIFISHIHEDEIAANALQCFLASKLPNGSEIFISTQLQLGDEWLDKIRTALKAATVVIALMSPEAIKRPWINFEAGGAWFSDDKTLIPLCIGELNPANLPKPYSNIQGAHLEDRQNDVAWYIIQALWAILRLPGMPPPAFSNTDEAVEALYIGIQNWRTVRRAMAAYERRTANTAE
jgi:hypothetical protein